MRASLVLVLGTGRSGAVVHPEQSPSTARPALHRSASPPSRLHEAVLWFVCSRQFLVVRQRILVRSHCVFSRRNRLRVSSAGAPVLFLSLSVSSFKLVLRCPRALDFYVSVFTVFN